MNPNREIEDTRQHDDEYHRRLRRERERADYYDSADDKHDDISEEQRVRDER